MELTSDYFIGQYPEIAVDGFNQKIWKRKEFHDQNIAMSGLKGHQRRLQRYASPVTPYDEVLLFHEMGTGKTRSALAIAENALQAGRGINKVVILGPNSKLIRKVFTKELSKMKNISLEDAKKYMRKKYIFSTYTTFSGNYISGQNPQSLKKKWNNTVFILDEVHNLTRNIWKKNSSKAMFTRFRFLFNHERTPNRKIVLLSGTPMVDDARDILPIMNLILPGDNKLTLTNLEQFIKGRVSYLKSDIRGSVPKVIVEGEIKAPMQYLELDYINMSEFQTAAYNQVKDGEDGGVINEADEGIGGNAFLRAQRNVALFAFPKKNGKTLTSAKDWCSGNNFLPDFWTELSSSGNIDIEKVKKYSCKFANVLQHLQEGPWPIYVYSTPTGDDQENCPGPGLKLLRLILEKMKYKNFDGSGRGGNKFIYFTSASSPSTKTIDEFNKSTNRDGEVCKIILGSKASSEGYTFRNLKREIILTPHWNYAVIDQAIARGVRVNAHDKYPNGGQVKVSRLVAVPQGLSGMDIIDVNLYRVSEQKDKKIKKIEHILKVNSFDCAYNYQQNRRQGDNSRECDYIACNYSCAGIEGVPTVDGYPKPELYTKTWEKYYAPRDKIMNHIKNVFKTSTSVKFEDLATQLKGTVGKNGLLRVLSDLLINRTVIRRQNKRNCYLSNYKNIINLTLDLIEPVGRAVVVAPYYIENPVLLPDTGTDSIRQLENKRNKNKLEEYLHKPTLFFEKPNSECEECANISTLPIAIQEKLLEEALIASGSTALKIKQYFSAAVFKVNGTTVSALNFTFGNPKGSLRALHNGEWTNASAETVKAYKDKYEGETANEMIVNLVLEKSPDLSPDTIKNLLELSIEDLRNEVRKVDKKKYLPVDFEVDIPSAKKLSIGKDAQSLKKEQMVAIFISAGIEDLDMTDIMQVGDYFPWIGKAKTGPRYPIYSTDKVISQADIKKTREFIKSNASDLQFDDAKIKEILRLNTQTTLAVLYMKLKQMDRLFLDVDCGSAFKDRKNAKIMKNLADEVYGLFNYETCTLCIKGPLWLTSAKK